MTGSPEEVVVPPAAQSVERDQLVRDILEEGRQSRGLQRKELAEELRVHPRTLRNWMKDPSALTADQIERLAACLRLSAENKANLHLLTGRRAPLSAGELKGLPDLGVYRRLINGSHFPSILTDYAADNILCNAAFHDVFGRETPHRFAHPLQSGLKYILFHPNAYLMLGGGDVEAFREFWLMPSLAFFIAVWEQRPGDEKLLPIEREIQRRPELRRAYEATPGWIFRSGDIHVNPNARPFRDPRTGELTTVHIMAEGHQGYHALDLSHVTFIFADTPVPPVPDGS